MGDYSIDDVKALFCNYKVAVGNILYFIGVNGVEYKVRVDQYKSGNRLFMGTYLDGYCPRNYNRSILQGEAPFLSVYNYSTSPRLDWNK